MRTNTIWVTFTKEGIHRYPQAATDPALKDVSFLGYDHRHIFHFRVELQVHHEDRDIEFILLKRELEQLYGTGVLEIDFKSCEMLANDVVDYLIGVDKYKGRNIAVTVSEDGENGGTVTYKDDTNDKQDGYHRRGS